jgi:hypothetical protein
MDKGGTPSRSFGLFEEQVERMGSTCIFSDALALFLLLLIQTCTYLPTRLLLHPRLHAFARLPRVYHRFTLRILLWTGAGE